MVRPMVIAAALGGGLLAVAGVFILTTGSDDDPTSDPGRGTAANATTAAPGQPPASSSADRPGEAPTGVDDLSLTFGVDGPVQRGVGVAVSVATARDVTEMQFSTDPTFAGAVWQPFTPDTTVRLDDDGYQLVYVRVRSDADSAPIGPAVAGIEVDHTWEAATASASGGSHRPSWARLVAPDVMQVRVETGRIRWNGDAPFDSFIGSQLDTEGLDSPESFEVTGATVTGVSRITRPLGAGDLDGGYAAPLIHDLYLTLAAPLTLGTEHTVSFAADIEPLTFSIDDANTVSSSIHVNQIGFAPNDEGKIALISAVTGDADPISLATAQPFQVRRTADDSVVFEGTTERASTSGPATANEWGKGDLTGTAVDEADFSAVTEPGRYRVCVTGLGCSEDFSISDESSWRRVMVAVAKSAYHQRSGIALGPPYTAVTRPRSFHPDDGWTFERVESTMIDEGYSIGQDDRFDDYEAGTTGESVPNAWGGHYDAGDWNSRIQHLEYLRMGLDLVSLFPASMDDVELAIPESGDAIPDLIDEGLWDLDLYMRLQRDDGAVPGMVDQRADEGDTSWDNQSRVFVYSPDVWSSYVYAGVAAQAATVLSAYDSDRSADYRDSALAAMTWAEDNRADLTNTDEGVVDAVDAERAVAAAAMLQMTGDTGWHDVFVDASSLDDGPHDLLDCIGPWCNAAWLYTQLDADLREPAVHDNAVASFTNTADALLEAQATSPFAFLMERPDYPIVWGLGPSTPHGVTLLRAFVITGDERYRTAVVRGASFSLGGNPLNTVFATGLGATSVRAPLILDVKVGGLPVWPGTFVYGIHDLGFDGSDDWVENDVLIPDGVEPHPLDVPLLQSWYDHSSLPMMNEFTFYQSHAPTLWTMGVLAAT